jgi:hypothetical protein
MKTVHHAVRWVAWLRNTILPLHNQAVQTLENAFTETKCSSLRFENCDLYCAVRRTALSPSTESCAYNKKEKLHIPTHATSFQVGRVERGTRSLWCCAMDPAYSTYLYTHYNLWDVVFHTALTASSRNYALQNTTCRTDYRIFRNISRTSFSSKYIPRKWKCVWEKQNSHDSVYNILTEFGIPVKLGYRPAEIMFGQSRIWGSHGREYEDDCILGCSAV